MSLFCDLEELEEDNNFIEEETELEAEEARRVLEANRDDMFLYRVIEEFCSKFKGEITREEVISRLKENGFNGLALVDQKDFKRLNSKRRKVDAAGVYLSEHKFICLSREYAKYNLEIGTHELTHALINDTMQVTVGSDSEGEVFYGIGFEEGVCTAVERKKGASGCGTRGKLRFGYERNYNTIRQFDLLYKKSKYKRYDSIVVEAIKYPKEFFNLIYRIILENLNGLFEKANKEVTKQELMQIALRCSFINLHSSDMLIEFLDQFASDKDCENASRIHSLSRIINVILLSNCDSKLKDGIVSKKYIGPFKECDFPMVKLGEADMLYEALFECASPHYAILLRYLDNALVEYVNIVDTLQKEVDRKYLEHKN